MKTICLDLTATELFRLRMEPLSFVKTPTGLVWLPQRMTQRIAVEPSSGCWLVSGHNTGKGHAKVWVAGKSRQFHRVIYQLLVGEIPAGHLLDHVKARGCLHRNCANPNHLEPVTTAENTSRGDGPMHWFKRKVA